MAVFINGRTAVHKGSGGTLTTQDTCKNHKNKPVTYSNIAKSADADNCAASVFINGNPVCHKNSNFKQSKGDEGGVNKGVKSGTIQGKAEFVSASADVFIEGIPAVRQNELMVSNNRNTSPAQLIQPGNPPPPLNANVQYHPLANPVEPYDVDVDRGNTQPTALFTLITTEDDANA